jgi:hypothetical protein
MNEAEDFEFEKHELEMIKKIFKPVGSIFIDGNFYQEEGEEEGT